MSYSYLIMGSPDDGFTSAEIIEDSNAIGRVFELEDGWYVHLIEPERLTDSELVNVILIAKEELKHYVNRKGATFPEDWSRAAVSLWLMQRDDGKGFTLSGDE
ncbi:MAG: hypothetical protein KY468_10985 [Armatimonadetes bacterium]|nr:hypothetical protein [Armatimonadota bacterium]